MFDSIRLRLAFWHLTILSALQLSLCLGVYIFIYEHLIWKADRILQSVMQSAAASVTLATFSGTAYSQNADVLLRALDNGETPVVIYDGAAHVLAERPSGAARITPLGNQPPSDGQVEFYTLKGGPGQRIGVRRVGILHTGNGPEQIGYYIAASQSLDSRLAELHTARLAFVIAMPVLLLLTGFGGWLLAGRSLAPATAMSDRARHINADNLDERIVAENPRDELGQLASSFNELLDRISEASLREKRFMADAAHELRTPISVIQTATAITLASEARSNDEYRSILTTIDAYAKRLSRNVDDVFRLTRADAGFKTIQIQSLYLDEVVMESVAAARVLAQTKSISVEVLPMFEAPFRGDEALLGEMFLNLMENAIKYTPAGGAIRISLRIMEQIYQVTVQDNGVGISEADRVHIFERFYRAQPAFAEIPNNSEGSGLGLAIALWIARSHGGSIELLSSGAGGSTFLAVLPRN